MKKILFKKLFIKNFRNITELEVDFNEKTNLIVGENGIGKTNTLNAILWCLFGRNIEDSKMFVISPIVDGVEDNSINTTVKLVLDSGYVIERSYKNRVTNLKTGWIIDGVESLVAITQAKYKLELEENLVDEPIFTSLSNINYLPNLNWKDLKTLIFDLIGDIKDEEVLIRDDFGLIEEYVRKFGIEQTQKLLNETDKTLNAEIKSLEVEYQTLLNTKDKYVVEDDKHEELEKRKEEIEKMLYANKKLQESNMKAIEDFRKAEQERINLQKEFERYEFKVEDLEIQIKDYESLYKANAYNVELARKKDLDEIQYSIGTQKQFNDYLLREIEKANLKLKLLIDTGNELKSKEMKVENSKCSTCGQELPEEQINEVLNKLKQKQEEDLIEIKNQCDLVRKEIKNYEENLEDGKEKLKKLELRKQDIETCEYQEIGESEKQKQIRVFKEEKELQLSEAKKEMSKVEKQLEIAKSNAMEKPEISTRDDTPLRLELDDINEKLATTITLQKISEDVENALTRLNEKKDNKITNKNKLQEVVKFNNIKADLLQKRVRNYFKICNFRTKEFTQTGDEVETFKIVTDNNVEFKETNTANKILLGLDLVQGIMKAKEIYTPILIDNFECITSDIETDTQLILAKASKGINKLEVK